MLILNISTDSKKVKHLTFSQLSVKFCKLFFLVYKAPLFLANSGQFKRSNFLARTWIEYFHRYIFVILGVYLEGKK